MKSGVEINTREIEVLFMGLKKELGAGERVARAGFYASDIHKDSNKSIAEIALINEYGAVIKIPERVQNITQYKRVRKDGTWANDDARFVRKSRANIAFDYKNVKIPAHTVIIPPRPFLRAAANEIAKKAPRKLEHLLSDGIYSLDQITKQIALYMADEIKHQITRGSWVPNAPSTIAQKHSSKPLVDTGNMRDSVHSAVILNNEQSEIKKE